MFAPADDNQNLVTQKVASETGDTDTHGSQGASIRSPHSVAQAKLQAVADNQQVHQLAQMQSMANRYADATLRTQQYDPLLNDKNSITQRQYNGSTDPESAQARELREMLIGADMMSTDSAAPRHARFLAMVGSDTSYSQDEIMEALGAMEADPDIEAADVALDEEGDWGDAEWSDGEWGDEEGDGGDESANLEDVVDEVIDAQDEAEVQAQVEEIVGDLFGDTTNTSTIIWTGGNLPTQKIALFKQTLVALDLDEIPLSDALSVLLLDNTRFAEDEEEHLILKGMFTADDIRQQLDQEIEFAENVSMVEAKLNAVGAAPVVYRPSSAQLLSPANEHISDGWTTFEALADIPTPVARTKNIIVTMGHGASTGHTMFGADGLLTQQQISTGLGLQGDIGEALLYIPLQCHPSAAVRAGIARGWKSGSVESEETISSGDIRNWINLSLAALISAWVG